LSLAVDAQEITNTTVAAVRAGRADEKEERYRIGYQDVLEVIVYTVKNRPVISQSVNVSPDGTIRLPAIEAVPAVCKTERELASDLMQAYGKDYLRTPFVSVRAVEQRSQSFAVIGAVEKPGLYYINQKVTLLQLLSFAGGPDAEKAGTKLIVARTGSNSTCRRADEAVAGAAADAELQVFQYNIKDVLSTKQNLLMKPGDIVSVLDADVIYVYGNVNKQGAVKLTRPLTLRQAIASAEGFAPASKKDRIKILRQKEGTTEWDPIEFNLKEIDNGKVPDPLLLPNDIVAVSEDSVKSILRTVGKSLSGGLSGVFYRIP
jgi:polysaccharide export outer membrane protein